MFLSLVLASSTPPPLPGKITPPFNHLVLNLTVHSVTETEQLEFILDTSRQYTYLSKTAMRSVTGNKRAADVAIEGVGLRCFLAEHWMREMGREVNVLGMDFLMLARASVVVDYGNSTFALVRDLVYNFD
jgi:hypothetical protein